MTDFIGLNYISGTFGKEYEREIIDGPLQGLHSRCFIALDENRNVIYTQKVAEILNTPDYQSALVVSN